MSSFPTRHGTAQGSSLERTMAERVDTQGFRTVINTNPDGSTTMLRTRGGNLEYTTTSLLKTIEPPKTECARGFVVCADSEDHGVLFDPQTFDALKQSYSPVKHGYAVMSFESTYAGGGGVYKYLDVVSFYNPAIFVNGKRLDSVRGAQISGIYIPNVIEKIVDEKPTYGTIDEQRVFLVGDTEIIATASEERAKLGSISDRLENRAVVCGQRLEGKYTAVMMQFSFSGHSWDSLSAAWRLTSTVVDMSVEANPDPLPDDSHHLTSKTIVRATEYFPPPPTIQPAISGTEVVDYELPVITTALVGVGQAVHIEPGVSRVRYPWSSTLSYKFAGYLSTAYTGSRYNSETTSSNTDGFETVTLSAKNELILRLNTCGIGTEYQVVPLISDPQFYAQMYADDTDYPLNRNTRGSSVMAVPALTIAAYDYSSTDQIATFHADMGGIRLVDINISRRTESGDTAAIDAHDWASAYLAEPSGGWGTSYGYNITGQGFPVTISPGANQETPENVAALRAKVVSIADSFSGGLAYSTTLDSVYSWEAIDRYDYTISARTPVDKSEITATTKDYLYYDLAASIFIYVEGEYRGTSSFGNGTSHLAVRLVVEAPFGTIRRVIYAKDFIFPVLAIENLEYDIWYIPSPKLSGVFAPLYRDQGAFKGVAYTTAAEVANGSELSVLINFEFLLETYHAIGDPPSDEIKFIPFNLLEMLYAYIYSLSYGVGEYDRYPIHYTAHYKAITEDLFGQRYKVAVANANGADGEWVGSVDAKYSEPDLKTGVYRT